MRFHKLLSALAAAALVMALASIAYAGSPDATSANTASIKASVHPAALRSPDTMTLAAAGPNYGLFRCQVGTDPSGAVCYDPYQMRHAYNTDNLIHAGSKNSAKPGIL
jgi:hypothetical protein